MKKQTKKQSIGPIPLKKVYNKLIISNIIWSLGILMMIVCGVCVNNFVGKEFNIQNSNHSYSGEAMWIGNIVWSTIIFVIGYSLSLFFTIKMNFKCEKPYVKKWALAASITVNALPFFGALISYIYKILNKKAYNKLQIKKNKNFVKDKPFIPASITIIFMILIIAVVAVWLVYMIKGGIIDDESGLVKPVPGILNIFAAPIEGFINAADLIVFLICIGGFLSVVTETRALDAGIGTLVKKMNGKEIWLIPILMTLFAIGGATFGMCEETLPFYLIIIPIMIAGGFDVFTAFLLILTGAGVGVASSIINPFVVTLSVDAINNAMGSEIVSMSDGIIFRIIAFVLFVSIAIKFVMVYAKKVKAKPEKSIVYNERAKFNKAFSFDQTTVPPLTGKRKAILAVFGLSFLVMIFMVINWQGLTGWDGFNDFNAWLTAIFPFVLTPDGNISAAIGTWYLIEMGMLFFFASLIVAIIDWKSEQNYLNAFYNGAKDFITVGLIIATARGISILLSSSGLDTLIVDGLSTALGAMNIIPSMLLIFVVFLLLSFLIPSTSGFANAVMPIVGPALSNSAIPVSGGIMTFAFTSGLINMTSPTSGPFVAALSLSKMELTDYYKGAWKLILILLVVMLVMLLIGASLVQFGILSNQGSVIF